MVSNPPEVKTSAEAKASPGIAPAVRSFVFTAIACAIVFLLFSPSGLLFKNAGLGFLVLPWMSFFVLRFLAKMSVLYLPGSGSSNTGEVVSIILNGLAFAVFFYLFLNKVQQLDAVWIFIHMKGFLTDLNTTAGWAVLFIAGVTIYNVAARVSGHRWAPPDWRAAFFPLAMALGQFLAGLGIWQFLSAFSRESAVWSNVGLVILAGMITAAIANIGYYLGNINNPFFRDASRWLTHTPVQKFSIGALIAIYILFARPYIVSSFKYAPIVEWALVCLIGWRLFSGIKNGIRLRCAVDVNETDWQKHVQLINNLLGADFPYLKEMQEAFVVDGGRGSLLIYLTLLLHDNKVPPEEINRILHQLINYQDVKMPWFAFGWEQRRALRQNEAKRAAILEDIVANLNYILNPANRKIEEHVHEQS
jgi:hypothetical protein